MSLLGPRFRSILTPVQTFWQGMAPAAHERLAAKCDVFLPNACPAEGGALAVPGQAELICPTGGIVNNILMQCLHAQFSDEMCRVGQPPLFLKGGLWSGGGTFNAAIGPTLERRGF